MKNQRKASVLPIAGTFHPYVIKNVGITGFSLINERSYLPNKPAATVHSHLWIMPDNK